MIKHSQQHPVATENTKNIKQVDALNEVHKISKMQETSHWGILDIHIYNLSETATRIIIVNTNTDNELA